MPYTGHNDPKLPPSVKKLPANKRRQWVSVFNSTLKNCLSPKIGAAGSLKKCESVAFRFANGAVKEVNMAESDDDPIQVEEAVEGESGEKNCDMIEIAPPAFGGAISFDDTDAYEEARDFDSNSSRQKYLFDRIFDNIMALPEDEMDMAEKLVHVRAAVAELANRIENPPEMKELGLVGRAMGAVGRFVGGKEKELQEPPTEQFGFAEFEDLGAFYVTKDLHGALRWVAIVSNKYWDRDGETFSEASHEEFTDLANETKRFSELRLWHVPGSRIGKEDFTAYADGFVLSSGTFDKGMEDVAESLAAMKEGLRISHGYRYKLADLDSEGVYRKYRRFEITILPREKAANPWTSFVGETFRKEVFSMPLKPDQKAFLVEHLGEERTDKIEAALGDLNKELQEAGVGWKEFSAALEGAPEGSKPAAKEQKSADADPAAAGTKEEDPTAGDPQAVATQGETDALAQIAQMVEGAVAKAVAPLGVQMAELAGKVKGLEVSDEDKIANQLAPKARAVAASAARPTDSEGNVVDPEEAEKITKAQSGEGDVPASVAKGREYAELMTGQRLPSG